MGYVETLFGHQDHILSVDALRGETCVSVGGRDKTVRFWKIVEETQLVFRGGGRSRIREVLDGGLRGDDEGDDPDEAEGERAKETTKKFIEGSIECVAMIDETTFVSGGDSGYVRSMTFALDYLLILVLVPSACGRRLRKNRYSQSLLLTASMMHTARLRV